MSLRTSAESAILNSTHSQENRGDIGVAIRRPDGWGHQSRFRPEGIVDAGTRRNVLHDVKARILERSRRSLASPTDVSFYSQTVVWGAGPPGSPVLGVKDTLDRLTLFLIAIGRSSDGTAAAVE